MTTAKPKVVVVGGGFGGLACARALQAWPVSVHLIDSHNYHLFTPLLYQVATGLLNPSDIAYPFRTCFRGSPNVRFQQARVATVDESAKHLVTEAGETISYDYLVLATGSTNNYFGDPALAAFTLGMKTLEEALRLRNHVLNCLEQAAQTTDEAERRRQLTFVVIGGGPTGVEYAGALGELLQLVLGTEFPELDVHWARVVVVEGQDRLLHTMKPRLGRYAAKTLQRRGIEVRAGVMVSRVTPDTVELSDGNAIPTATVVWSAGVKPDLPRNSAGPMKGRITVDGDFRIVGWPGSFAIGDGAAFTGSDGEILPMLSAPAMQGGRHVARVILDDIGIGPPGEPRAPFRYIDKGTMATIGRNAAVGQIKRFQMTGFIGWVAWLAVHLYYLAGFRNRLVVLSTWGFNYLHRDRPIRIIARADE